MLRRGEERGELGPLPGSQVRLLVSGTSPCPYSLHGFLAVTIRASRQGTPCPAAVDQAPVKGDLTPAGTRLHRPGLTRRMHLPSWPKLTETHGLPEPPRTCRQDLAGPALADLRLTRTETIRPHPGLCRLSGFFSDIAFELLSPVTESNRRPSPYHGHPTLPFASNVLGRNPVCQVILVLKGLGVPGRGWPSSPLIVPTTG
jgi:hypothetical protein